MSNLEVFFLTQEVAELRKLIGGRAVDIGAMLEGKKKLNKTFDDDLREIQTELQELRNTVASLSQELSKYKDGAVVSKETEAVVANLERDLKQSNDELSSVLLTEDEKAKDKKK